MTPLFRRQLIVVLFCCCLAVQNAPAAEPTTRRPAGQYSAVYDTATITEDATWNGTVLVKGALTVAPQATLRIEPGTVVRFAPARGVRQLPRLLVMGRIQASGSADRPILFSAGSAAPKRGEWGGILLISSEKKNQFEHCRIEGAETGIEARFSSFTARSVLIAQAATGMLLRDSTITMAASSFSGSNIGVEAHDSELELRDSAFAQNRRGLALYRSSAVLAAITVTANQLSGLLAEDCRLKLTSSEISGNGSGAQISGGEGQLLLTRFLRNGDTALHLSSARLKVFRCQFVDNIRDGVKLDDDRGTVWGNVFSGNGGYHLVNAGQENVSLTQNWWGSADEASILAKISDGARTGRSGRVTIFPWLTEKPVALP